MNEESIIKEQNDRFIARLMSITEEKVYIEESDECYKSFMADPFWADLRPIIPNENFKYNRRLDNYQQKMESYLGRLILIKEDYQKTGYVNEIYLGSTELNGYNVVGLDEGKQRCEEELIFIDQAISYIEKYLKERSLAGLYELKGLILFFLERYKESETFYNKVHDLDPKRGITYVKHADVCLSMGNYKDALRYCECSKRNILFNDGFLENRIIRKIYSSILHELETKGLIQGWRENYDIQKIRFINIESQHVQILTESEEILISSNGIKVVPKEYGMTIAKLKKYFKDSGNNTFIKDISGCGKLRRMYKFNNNTVVDVIPVHYLKPGDTLSCYAMYCGYENDFYTYVEGMYEVLLHGNCIGYVIKKRP